MNDAREFEFIFGCDLIIVLHSPTPSCHRSLLQCHRRSCGEHGQRNGRAAVHDVDTGRRRWARLRILCRQSLTKESSRRRDRNWLVYSS